MEFDKNKIRIFLDMDDVLVNWVGECVKLIGLNTEHPVVQHAIEETWGIGNLLNENRMWDVVHSLGESWWANLPILPWGKQLWDELNNRWPVTLLTSPSKDPSCLSGKKIWIDKNLPDAKRNFLIGKNKNWCANSRSVLIDDRPENCNLFVEAGGHAYLWPSASKMMRLSNEKTLNTDDVIEHCVKYVQRLEADILDLPEIKSGNQITYIL